MPHDQKFGTCLGWLAKPRINGTVTTLNALCVSSAGRTATTVQCPVTIAPVLTTHGGFARRHVDFGRCNCILFVHKIQTIAPQNCAYSTCCNATSTDCTNDQRHLACYLACFSEYPSESALTVSDHCPFPSLLAISCSPQDFSAPPPLVGLDCCCCCSQQLRVSFPALPRRKKFHSKESNPWVVRMPTVLSPQERTTNHHHQTLPPLHPRSCT